MVRLQLSSRRAGGLFVKQKLVLALFVIGTVLVADIATKRWALETLQSGMTVKVAGGMVPLTLAYNTGIAFGLNVPSAGRWILIAASLFVVAMLAGLFHNARENDFVRLSSVALVTAGAVGNLIDRVRWERGVVDFIGPFDLRFMHWPIFNVADMAITMGAILLGISLWREERRPATAPIEAPANAGLEES
jgi:signal peptidase II